ncbi:MAG: DNA mismatch repair protein MutS, partial [Proteobacteria bacterium]|nr:DNA mismatch repair protein MutS [Pseudomonadota bacterium]
MTTPMFEQYHELKSGHPDAILFFRMGDFYECFFEDAETVARELGLTLTARNKSNPNPVPMAGVPHHAAAGYIQRLIDKGYRVAIGEQTEDPAQAKGLVRREVVRVVTPGVVLDPTSLESKQPNYIVGVSGGDEYGIAFVDLSTGDFRLTSAASVEEVVGELHRLEPREAVLEANVSQEETILLALKRYGAVISPVEEEAWGQGEALRELTGVLQVSDLSGFGIDHDHSGVRAAGALIRYARDATGTDIRNIHAIHCYLTSGFLVIDDTTRRNLELTKTLINNSRRGSLIHLLDRGATPMGSRLLREWLSFPLMTPRAIVERQVAVEALYEQHHERAELRGALKTVTDMERGCARVVQKSANARDLSALRYSLLAIPLVVQTGARLDALESHLPRDIADDVAGDLDKWLVNDPPVGLTEGGLIRRGVHEELDEVLSLSLEGVGVIAALEAREREASGINSLKIKRNKVFGYFIEVTRAHLHRVPERYLRKQTLSNVERFITPELKELEEKVLGADERRKELEYELFVELRERVAEQTERILILARQLATIDALCSLAEVAMRYRWTRPRVTQTRGIEISGGRHPVVEALMEEERFVPNDMSLDAEERQLIVLTGPNMSGKSTVMRQVALIVLLAQMGSFVPASKATIGICDRIFTRVGATDDLTRGQSTFMVEMSETASILHNATKDSLVILDEIGRGTSTYDGLAIAWAVAEDIVDRIGCRTLFATHYHELCELAESRPGVFNQSVAVSEWGDTIIFLRRLKEGGASRSYGIQCARLAGLPVNVIERAKKLLTRFEKHAPKNERHQLSLFGQAGAPLDEEVEEAPPVDPLREALGATNPDQMSPREALDALYVLR